MTTEATLVPLSGIYQPDPEDRCEASANLRGAHVRCELHKDHEGWAHSNGEHELLWTGGVFA